MPAATWVTAGEVRLRVLRMGNPQREPLIMLHGMRDVALSLEPVASVLAEHYQVLLPDLRGHGESDQPGIYTLDHYLFDLHKIMEHLAIPSAAIFGHSLGGQILARFAALFPDRVKVAIIAEGLGPPARPFEGDAAREMAHYGPHLLETLGISGRQRPLPSLAFAAERLLQRNPRLGRRRAKTLAEHATRVVNGQLLWAFDPRVRSTFIGIRRADTERYWRLVRCPTLIVAGALAHEYWGQQINGIHGWDGRFAPGELEARAQCFTDHEVVMLAAAGHMVHYDQPAALTATVANFLERRL